VTSGPAFVRLGTPSAPGARAALRFSPKAASAGGVESVSSALALASVTAVLKDLLENGLASRGVTSKVGRESAVSALPPDRLASGADERVQLNLFLYLVSPHTALPSNGHGTHRGALALDLHYLLTAYGQQDLQTEILLGHALQVLQETPVLERERIRSTLKSLTQSRDRRVVSPQVAALASSTLADEVERLRIEPTFLSSEETSKLWSALQSKYRPSVTYKVSAVLIDGGTDS
jgi:hypothetical protein